VHPDALEGCPGQRVAGLLGVYACLHAAKIRWGEQIPPKRPASHGGTKRVVDMVLCAGQMCGDTPPQTTKYRKARTVLQNYSTVVVEGSGSSTGAM
jgi:hypothetical protein